MRPVLAHKDFEEDWKGSPLKRRNCANPSNRASTFPFCFQAPAALGSSSGTGPAQDRANSHLCVLSKAQVPPRPLMDPWRRSGVCRPKPRSRALRPSFGRTAINGRAPMFLTFPLMPPRQIAVRAFGCVPQVQKTHDGFIPVASRREAEGRRIICVLCWKVG